MSTAVVDTDVVSFLFKNHPIALQYLSDLANRALVISFMTVAELDRWVLEARWGEARRNRLQEYLEPFAVLPYDRALCSKWAEVMVAARSLRTADRLCRRLDRRYGTALQSALDHTQSQ